MNVATSKLASYPSIRGARQVSNGSKMQVAGKTQAAAMNQGQATSSTSTGAMVVQVTMWELWNRAMERLSTHSKATVAMRSIDEATVSIAHVSLGMERRCIEHCNQLTAVCYEVIARLTRVGCSVMPEQVSCEKPFSMIRGEKCAETLDG